MDNLESLMKKLGDAIDTSLRSSTHIDNAIAQIKNAGYDVFLVLEATVGFSKCEPEPTTNRPERPNIAFTDPGKIKFTTQDCRLLRALKIAVDEDQE